jgi:hypothetical protein
MMIAGIQITVGILETIKMQIIIESRIIAESMIIITTTTKGETKAKAIMENINFKNQSNKNKRVLY